MKPNSRFRPKNRHKDMRPKEGKDWGWGYGEKWHLKDRFGVYLMSKIEWTEKTWNPTTGCTKVSAGCKNCYAEVIHKRLNAMGTKGYEKPFNGVVYHNDRLNIPLKRKKPTTYFVNSMSDLFHENVPFNFIDKVFSVINRTRQHTYQILTKRPEIMKEYFSNRDFWNKNYGDKDKYARYCY